jgi:hypothetical protein
MPLVFGNALMFHLFPVATFLTDDGLRYSRLVSSSNGAIVFEVGSCPASARKAASATLSPLRGRFSAGWLLYQTRVCYSVL